MSILVDEKFMAELRKVEEPDVDAAIEKVERCLAELEGYAERKRDLIGYLRESTPDYEEALPGAALIHSDGGKLEQLAEDFERSAAELHGVVLERRDKNVLNR